MSAVPESPLVYGDSGYSRVYDLWIAQGSPSWLEYQKEGWLRKAIYPDGGATPTFVLVCSSAGETTEDKSSDVSGYGRTMASVQRSYQPRGTLPKDAV